MVADGNGYGIRPINGVSFLRIHMRMDIRVGGAIPFRCVAFCVAVDAQAFVVPCVLVPISEHFINCRNQLLINETATTREMIRISSNVL